MKRGLSLIHIYNRKLNKAPGSAGRKGTVTVQEITSSQNPRIKELVRLSSQKKERSLSGLFVVESAKLVEETALAGIGIEALYRTDEAAEKYAPYLAPAQAVCGSEVRITRPVAEKLAASQHTQGVFALCRIPEPSLTAESLSPQGRYLVLSSLQDLSLIHIYPR